MADLEAAKQARTSTKRLLTRTVNGIKRVMEKEDDIAILKSRFSDLKSFWKEVHKKHEEYVMLLATEDKQQSRGLLDRRSTRYLFRYREENVTLRNHKEREGNRVKWLKRN